MDQIKPGDHLEKKRWNSNPLETELKKSIKLTSHIPDRKIGLKRLAISQKKNVSL